MTETMQNRNKHNCPTPPLTPFPDLTYSERKQALPRCRVHTTIIPSTGIWGLPPSQLGFTCLFSGFGETEQGQQGMARCVLHTRQARICSACCQKKALGATRHTDTDRAEGAGAQSQTLKSNPAQNTRASNWLHPGC